MVGNRTLLNKLREVLREPERNPPPPICQRLVGTVVDSQGKGVPNVSVRVYSHLRLRDLKTTTGKNGWFILKEVPATEQDIFIKPSGRSKEELLSLFLAEHTTLSIVYDAQKRPLGVLSQYNYSETEYPTRLERNGWGVRLSGQCIGLEAVLGKFDIWFLWKPQTSSVYRVHHPPAQIDPTGQNWSVELLTGDAKNPPKSKDLWDAVVVATPRQSKMRQLKQIPDLRMLPPHIRTIPASFRIRAIKD